MGFTGLLVNSEKLKSFSRSGVVITHPTPSPTTEMKGWYDSLYRSTSVKLRCGLCVVRVVEL